MSPPRCDVAAVPAQTDPITAARFANHAGTAISRSANAAKCPLRTHVAKLL